MRVWRNRQISDVECVGVKTLSLARRLGFVPLANMFVRPCYRRKDGKRHAYWALVESYRTERGPRQRVVAYRGRLDEEGRLGVQQAARPNAHVDQRQQRLPFVEETSHDDSTDAKPRWVTVNASAVRVENCVQFGGPCLALELIKRPCWIQL